MVTLEEKRERSRRYAKTFKENHPQVINKRINAKYHEEPEFREKKKAYRRRPEVRSKINERQRATYFDRTYGEGTTERRDFLLEAQENACYICESVEPLVIDHCHKTGTVRLLLCHACNIGLAKFHEDPNLIRKAADYLELIFP